MTSKKIKTKDILGSNYYVYELSSSNYNPYINGSITITCTCKTVYGDAVSSKQLELYWNNESYDTSYTNSNGVATFIVEPLSYEGVQKFTIGNDSIFVAVTDESIDEIIIEYTGDDFTTMYYPFDSSAYNDVYIDWGDGTKETVNGGNENISHTYDESDDYTIRIRGMHYIQNGGFREINGLTSIILPKSIQNLNSQIFSSCYDLESAFIFSNITSLPNLCFEDCESLTSISLPSTVTSLGESCFAGTGLTDIILPNSVTSLGDYCFQGVPLSNIIFSNRLTTIGDDCFTGVSGNIVLPPSVTSIGDECFGGSDLESITIPYGVTSLPDDCFNNCTSLKEVNLPNTITSLGSYCFFLCSSLKEINLPNGLTTLGSNCFFRSGLVSVTIPSTVTSIDSYCFACVDNNNSRVLKKVVFEGSTPPSTIENDSFTNTNLTFYVPNGCVSTYTTSFASILSYMNGYSFKESSLSITITYSDNTTETVNLLKKI